MIKVLHIIGSGIIGGAEKLTLSLAKFQNSNSFLVISSVLFINPYGQLLDKINDEIKIQYFNSDNMNILQLIKCVKLFSKFDIIHFHGPYVKLFLPAMLSKRSIFYFIHGTRFNTKSIVDFLDYNSRNITLPTYNGIKRFIKKIYLSCFLNYAVDHINSPSEYYKYFYEHKYKLKKGKIDVLPLGLNFSEYKVTTSRDKMRESLGINNNTFVIGNVTTYRKLKRTDRLISGFKNFLQLTAVKDVRLIIIGDGEEKHDILLKIKDDPLLAENILLLPAQLNVANYLNMFDIYVNPSESESFSLSVVESMLFNLPVIAYNDSKGLAELLSAADGFLINTNDELSAIMFRLYQDPIFRKEAGQKLRNYAIENLSIKRMSDNLEAKYKKYHFKYS